jgi:hypothetical protein
MVSNKGRKTNYKDLSVTEEAATKFDELATDGETRTDTLLKIINGYKSKCLDQKAQA